MKLTVVGCSGSFPGPVSPASCYLVEAAGFRVLLDLGNGALGALQQHADIYAIDAVLLSHLHADHCLDLCSYYVARKYRPGGPAPRIPVYGPSGTGPRMARAYDDLHAQLGMSEEFEFLTWPGGPFRLGPLTVTAARVNHPVEAYGMRIEHAGAVLAYSGDTGVTDSLVELARDTDLFLCEASFHVAQDAGDDVHLTGRGAAEHAAKAAARRLVLTHVPPWNDPERTLEEARPGYGGPLELARPGSVYSVGAAG